MTMIVENGSGISNANSYATLQYVNDYHSTYGHDDWSGTDAEKELAIILATQSIDLLYGDKYISYKYINATGALLWPRMWCYDNNQQLINTTDVPKSLKNAVAEVALMHMNGENILPTKNTDQNLIYDMVTIDTIEIRKQYEKGGKGNVENFAGFNKIDLLLRPILKEHAKRTISIKR